MSYFLKKLRLARFLTGRIPTLGVAQWSQGMRDRNMAYAATELSVIKGAGERLQDMRWIYSEVSIDPIYRGAPLWGELHEFLMRSGFELRKVDGFAGAGESVQWADALYANVRMR
jgi:hypothetical protein